jgi:glycosyltransferase involved in cell wall biosynthesis/2-polyprenyl-3-methyl-5-hydroxy-6-metoxy-1,4-benzoquinol methylase
MSPTQVVRMIGRLNVGGRSIQAITLSQRLTERGYDTVLVRGSEGPREGTMDHLAERLGVRPVTIESLRRDFGWHDLAALIRTLWLLARIRPAILHTHAAKGGAIGRLAATLLGPLGPPVRVHTFHGHVLTGYFSRRSSAAFLAIERFLAARTTRLIAVSDEVRDELVDLGVASRERIEVIPLGFDLTPFQDEAGRLERRSAFRSSLALAEDEPVVMLVARLVPIKRVDRFLAIARRVAAAHPDTRFVIVGDGELSDELRDSDDAAALGERLVWAGMRLDMPAVLDGSDIVVLTSDNEGTPVSLIEAQAAGRPTVATAVGGVASVVVDGQTGYTIAVSDLDGFAGAIGSLLEDPALGSELGRRGQAHVRDRFRLERLVSDVDTLYRALLASRPEASRASRRERAASSSDVNVHPETVEGFGDEWTTFDQQSLSASELRESFEAYFRIFPWNALRPDAVGFDAGCGSGRWARLVAPRVGRLHCVDASAEVLSVARRVLAEKENCSFHHASVGTLPFADATMDFGYSLGVLHHVPDPAAALRECVRVLRPGAPLLVYLYYALDNRPWWYTSLWWVSDRVRRVVSRQPHRAKLAVSTAVAITVYWPLARAARLIDCLGGPAESLPLGFYRFHSFYTMRTDAYDRFSTRLEQRFSREEVMTLMEDADLRQVRISERSPFWCAVGTRV